MYSFEKYHFMKNVLITLSIYFISNIAFSQDIPQLKLTKDGVAPVTIEVNDLSRSTIYDKSLMWVNENYLNPKDAIKENIENEQLNVQGFKRKAWWYKSMGLKNYNHMYYTIQLNFKEGSFDVEYIIGEFFINEGISAQYDYRMFFKKDGTVRKQYVDAVASLELTMNTLLISLYNYVSGNSLQPEKKDLNKYLITLQQSLYEDSTNPETHFELACFYSLIQDKDKSFDHLNKSVFYGYKNLKNIEKEPDLKWIRHQDGFKEFKANGYKIVAPVTKTAVITTSTDNYIEELRELGKLKDEGIITEKEFQELKEKILNRVKKE